MSKEYIGSQEHFEDEVNAYYDKQEHMNKDQEKAIEKEMYEQMERDLFTEHSCRSCIYLYWNEGENIFDCQLGYLGKWSYADIDSINECEDYKQPTPST
jgi:hypothetical protein